MYMSEYWIHKLAYKILSYVRDKYINLNVISWVKSFKKAFFILK